MTKDFVRRKKISASDKLKIVMDIEAGYYNEDQAALRNEVNRGTVIYWMRQFGTQETKDMLSRRLRAKRLDQNAMAAGMELYRSGLSLGQAARRSHCSDSALYTFIHSRDPELLRSRHAHNGKRDYAFRKPMNMAVQKLIPERVSIVASKTFEDVLKSPTVREPSSIRPLTKQELMCGKVGGYGAKVQS